MNSKRRYRRRRRERLRHEHQQCAIRLALACPPILGYRDEHYYTPFYDSLVYREPRFGGGA